MIDRGRLALKSVDRRTVLDKFVGKKPQSDFAAEFDVLGAIDDTPSLRRPSFSMVTI
jgi:hypothetical protein